MLGYIAIVFGLLSSFESVITAVIIILVGVFLGFSKAILEIEPKSKRLRNYPFLMGLKLGSWSSYKEYNYVSILRRNVSETTFGGRTNKSVTTKDIFFDICLLNDNHRKKLTVKRFKSKEEALNEIERLSTDLGLDVVTYNPVRSTATKRRR